LEDGRPYFTMKLVKGRTLADLLAERKSPAEDMPRFVAVFEQVCQTVAYAHSRGILHRDLKPANVMVGEFGEVQVMDWGLAKVLTAAPPPEAPASTPARSTIFTVRTADPDGISQAGSVLGTPAYMAPEQARGAVDVLDARADVFGLGALLCEILTGKPPYVGRDAMEVQIKAATADLKDALARLPACEADAELAALAAGCLDPNRERRPRARRGRGGRGRHRLPTVGGGAPPRSGAGPGGGAGCSAATEPATALDRGAGRLGAGDVCGAGRRRRVVHAAARRPRAGCRGRPG
jgi:serine/threonine-protein kinase